MKRPLRNAALFVIAAALTVSLHAADGSSTPAGLPDAAGSVGRTLGALAFVVALFFGGVWLFRNWQRMLQSRSGSKLNVIEARSLGPRQAVYVLAYEQQRFLIGASAAGVSLLTELPDAEPSTAAANREGSVGPAFGQFLQHARKALLATGGGRS